MGDVLAVDCCLVLFYGKRLVSSAVAVRAGVEVKEPRVARREVIVLTIRLEKAEWAKAWRAMIEVGPVRLIGDDPVYEVLPANLELLTARGFTYEVVTMRPRRVEKRRPGTAD
jgi:hypothetical protein